MKPPRPILLVEDNPSDVALTRQALERNGIRNELVVASDGRAALQLLQGNAPSGKAALDPQVVLLELRASDALHLLRGMREMTRARYVPVVVLTSSSDEADIVDSYRLGANSYIRKPADVADFANTARELTRYWVLLNEPFPRTEGRAR